MNRERLNNNWKIYLSRQIFKNNDYCGPQDLKGANSSK